jgi:hypothetical protein
MFCLNLHPAVEQQYRALRKLQKARLGRADEATTAETPLRKVRGAQRGRESLIERE